MVRPTGGHLSPHHQTQGGCVHLRRGSGHRQKNIERYKTEPDKRSFKGPFGGLFFVGSFGQGLAVQDQIRRLFPDHNGRGIGVA
jgi:hypothetical protein